MTSLAYQQTEETHPVPGGTGRLLDESASAYGYYLAARAALAAQGHIVLRFQTRPEHIVTDIRQAFRQQNLIEPHWEEAAAHLFDLIAELVTELAYSTQARSVSVSLTIGKNLPASSQVDSMKIHASVHCQEPQKGIFHRLAGNERATDALIALGMTVLCEPVDPGFRRLQDAQTQTENLTQSDVVFGWTERTLRMLFELKDFLAQREQLHAPHGHEAVKAGCRDMINYFQVICGEHILRRNARIRASAQRSAHTAHIGDRMVHVAVAGSSGSAHAGRYIHPALKAAGFAAPYHRTSAAQHATAREIFRESFPHHPLHQAHPHNAELEPVPEEV